MSLRAYRREVWLLLHKDENPERETASVRLYLDESGGDELSHVVVAGMLINRSHFLHFEDAWDDMLVNHGIVAPLHTKEFGKHGRFSAITKCCREELFSEAVELIMSHKICSIAATLSMAEYRASIPEEVREVYSSYAMCFSMATIMNHKLAEGRYEGRIPLIFDIGNPCSDDIRKTHANALRLQKEGAYLHLGGLYFDDDADFGSLQAADIIAWGVRRKLSNLPFPPGMESIANLLLPESGHKENCWKGELLQMLKDGLAVRMVEAKKEIGEDH